MFDRRKYKKYARMQLKGRWSTPILMTLICCAIIMFLEAPDFKEFFTEYLNMMESSPSITQNDGNFYSELRSFAALLIEYVILYAQIFVYIKMSKSPEPVHFSDFVEGFNNWARGILAGLWESLWTFLWSLLFIIPGIVKHYAYSQTKFLVTEFPNLSITKAMKISIAITNGHKADLFILDLSFIGWLFLSMIPCGAGLLWLVPYRELTLTNAFHSLLKDAVAVGMVTSDDLAGRYE